MRLPSVSLFLLSLGLLVAGCGRHVTPVEKANQDKVLLLGNGSEPSDLDPQSTTSVTESHITRALFEGLTTYDAKTCEPVPGAAERWEISPDGLEWTFHIRPNARWSNGDPLMASDFVWSYQRILTESFASEYAYMLFVLKNAEDFYLGKTKDFSQVGITALDDKRLKFTLQNPTPHLAAMLCHGSWFPVHPASVLKYGTMTQRFNTWTRPGRLVSNGPFQLSEWVVSSHVRGVKNPHYWNSANVKLNGIVFYPLDNLNTEERAFRCGMIHSTVSLPIAKRPQYIRENPPEFHRFPALWTQYYIFNVTKKPFDDVRVRKAFSLAMDRESIVQNITRGGELPAYGLTPPNTGGYTCRTKVEENVAKAQALMAEAGYPQGKGIGPIKLLLGNNDSQKILADGLVEMWRKNLGVEIELERKEAKVYLDEQTLGNFQISRAGWIGDFNDASNFLDLMTANSGNNRTRWKNPKYDEFLAQAARTADPVKRKECFQQAEALLIEEMPLLLINFGVNVSLRAQNVKGFHENLLDVHPPQFVSLE